MKTARLVARSIPRPSGVTGAIAVAVFLLFAGTMLTTILAVGIWPGEVKLVAPLFCDDAQPDAFVVSDTYSSQPGETTTNFTLYCMGPAGDATDHGFFLPFVATAGLNTAAVVVLIAGSRLLRALRGRRRLPLGSPVGSPTVGDVGPGPGSTAGPFVD